jgi:predicted DCC family thiol-disulfide oxidoreductase YuxK
MPNESAAHPAPDQAGAVRARAVLLYDGHCRLCQAASLRLARLARAGTVERADFQDPAVLARFPEVDHERCMRELLLVTPDGRVLGGLEAVVATLGTRGRLWRWARIYYWPGLRRLADAVYAWIARHRYRLGRAPACEDAACALHLRRP